VKDRNNLPPSPYPDAFTRQKHEDGPIDSICLKCSAKIRAETLRSLETAEKIHLKYCPNRPKNPSATQN
jgi:hypothetical protein